MENKIIFTKKKKLNVNRITGNKGKKYLPIIFFFIIFLSGFTASATFSNLIIGPDKAIAGSVSNYTYNFMSTPPTTIPMPVSARLDVVGGVFVSPQGVVSTYLYPTVNGSTNFQVRWQTTGKITSTFVIGNIPYVSNNGQTSGTLVYNVTVVPDIPTITFVFNGDPNGLGRNKTYTVTAANAATYDWTTTGDVSIISKSGGNATIQTGPNFTTGSIQVRGQNFVNWTDWKSISLNFDCSVPAGLYIRGDHDDTHIYRVYNGSEGYSYKFHAIVANALEYEWHVEGGANKINSANGNVLDIKFYPFFSHNILSVRARKNCGWSAWVYYDVYEYVPTPTDPCAGKTNPAAPTGLNITTSLDNRLLCSPTSGNATINVIGGVDKYVWLINNGCMTSFGYNCTTQAEVPNYIKSTSFTMNPSDIGSYFDTEIAVRVYYCGGERYVQVNKIISGNKLYCAKENAAENMLNETIEVTSDKLILYPNPAQDLLHVGGCDNIRIFNSQGQMVKEIKENVEVLDVKDLNEGIYILKANRNGLPVSSTFTKE